MLEKQFSVEAEILISREAIQLVNDSHIYIHMFKALLSIVHALQVKVSKNKSANV